MTFYIVFYNFANMKKYIWLLAVSASFCSCAETQDEKAAPLMAQIEALYDAGNYRQTLDSIMSLRKDFPEAVESRIEDLAECFLEDGTGRCSQDRFHFASYFTGTSWQGNKLSI